uniref:Uncharacterized protein n=1 Tax=Plectus sambesii TaxID=2011161 RepID=A0A914VFY5_9BILA
MLGKLLIALLIVGFVTAGPVASNQEVVLAGNTTCKTNPPVTPCVLAFFANFGFAGQNGGYPPNTTTFGIALDQYLLKNDIAGWNNLKTWMTTFISCAGGQANFDACLDWQVLMQLCYLPKDAALYYEISFRVLEFETTTPAFDVITHNWFCIKGVEMQEGPIIKQCLQHFTDQQHNNPNMTCQNFGEYLNCIERPYVLHCGRDVGAVSCAAEKIEYAIIYPDCADHVALQCNGPSAFKKYPRLH